MIYQLFQHEAGIPQTEFSDYSKDRTTEATCFK